MTTSLPYFLELATSASPRAPGLAFVGGAPRLDPERIVAFGDGENDVEPLEWAGYGVAVAQRTRCCASAPTGSARRPPRRASRRAGGVPRFRS